MRHDRTKSENTPLGGTGYRGARRKPSRGWDGRDPQAGPEPACEMTRFGQLAVSGVSFSPPSRCGRTRSYQASLPSFGRDIIAASLAFISASCLSNIAFAAEVRFSVSRSRLFVHQSKDSTRGRLSPEKCGMT